MTQPDLNDTERIHTYSRSSGNTITVGQYLRDKREHNTRTLRIDRIFENTYGAVRTACTVVGVDGVAIAKTRETEIDAIALAGPNFLPTTAPAAAENALEETR